MINKKMNLCAKANQAWEEGAAKRAFALFLAAADHGEKDAFNTVGYFLEHGIGVEKDHKGAFMWYRRAALRGNLAGCLNLAVCYLNDGKIQRAIFWFERAYSKGDGSAAYELGKIYANRYSSNSKVLAKKYLAAAITSKFIMEDERVLAKNLLNGLNN